MRANSYLLCCAALFALGFAAEGGAQQTGQAPPLSTQEQQELRQLLRQFDPERPSPVNLPVSEQRWLLTQLRDLSAVALVPAEVETLRVCDVIGDPHLKVGDMVKLDRLGSSGNVRMEILRNAGTPTESHPWTGPNGGNTFVVNPSITGKTHATNPAFKKFTPEGVGRAHVDPHTGGTPTDHDFSLRRNTRTPDAKCSNPDPLMLSVPEQHPAGNRHGGHAVLD